MRVSFPSFNSRILAAAGTSALLVLIIVLVTGGFVLQAGPLRFSARRATAPLMVALLAWGLAARGGRDTLRDAGLAVTRFAERWATALAIVFAAAGAGAGIAYGTYAASGADAAGYVSQAQLISEGGLVRIEPLAVTVGWPQGEWSFSTLGYRPGLNPGEIVPTYPPGLPLAMAGLLVAAGDSGPFFVVPLLAAIAVLGAYGIGRRLHSRIAGVMAAALLATSPVFLFQAVQPMSDVAATAWWALALVCALAPVGGAPLAAGAAAGLAVLTRPNLLPLVLAVAVVVGGWRGELVRPARCRWRALVAFAVGLAPAFAALALVNRRLYGDAFASGYGGASELFSLTNIAPNLRDYAVRVAQGEWPALVVAAVALLSLWLRPGSAKLHVGALTRLAVLVTALTLACYLPYARFAEWSYLRFLLPAFPVMFACIGAVAAEALRRIPEAVRGAAALCVMTIVCSLNVMTASREQAFNLHRYEARYRTAGRYLQSALPANAVIVAVQQSASAGYYTALPVVRWDLLPIELDAALARLRGLGRHPVLLVEDWEMAGLAARFPASAAARLDWTPRADIGDTTRVRLFDPADRNPATDRLR